MKLRRLFIVALLIVLVSQSAISLYSWDLIEHKTVPELARKAATVGSLAAQSIHRALGYGIPLDKLEGVADYFDDIRHANPEIATLSLLDTQGAVLASSARADFAQLQVTPVRLVVDDKPVAEIRVGVDRGYLSARIAGMRVDMAIVLLTSMLIAFEVLLFLAARQNAFAPATTRANPSSIAMPLPGLQQLPELPGLPDMPPPALAENRVVKVRMLTFLFVFAELLLRIFLPLYGTEFVVAGSPLSPTLAASLPLSIYLLCAAIAMPRAGRWSDQIGRRRSYVIGAVVTMCGTLLGGVTIDFYILLAGRATAGVGFAIMFMACQGYIADDPDAGARSRGAAMFVSAIMVAEICGPAVGGILADRIGFRAVFMLSALLSLVALWLGARVLDDRGAHGPVVKFATRTSLRALLANRRYAALCFLSGAPGKILFVGFLTYLVPVLLTQGGANKSEIGRYAMVYGLLVLGLGPACAWLAERYRLHAHMVAGGGVLSGAGLLVFLAYPSSGAILLGIVALGIAQAMSLTAQFILVSEIARGTGADAGAGNAIGTFRLIERLGSAAGCAVAGALLAWFGAQAALAALGGYSILCAILFALVFRDADTGRGATGALHDTP